MFITDNLNRMGDYIAAQLTVIDRWKFEVDCYEKLLPRDFPL